MDAEEFTRLVNDLLRVRGKKGTQRRLAEQLGVDRRTIERYAKGQRGIRSKVSDKLRELWCEEVDAPDEGDANAA